MNQSQKIAIVAPPLLVVMMIGIFQAAKRWLGAKRAWYAGFLVYWPIWCILFPWALLGRKRIKELFRGKRPTASGWILFAIPSVMTFIGLSRMRYNQPDLRARLAAFLMPLVMGPLEEILWRGVYIELFPGNIVWGFVWPTFWFALWHFAPGTVSTIPPVTLMAGAAGFGACWSWLALKTGTIRWSTASHALTGLVRALG